MPFCEKPLEYLRVFLDAEIMDVIVYQSNLFSVQKNSEKPLGLTVHELEQWLGLVLFFSISKLPNTRMHWSKILAPFSDIASSVLSRNRFELIKSNLHLADNSLLSNDASSREDKLFKVRPLVNHLRQKFNQIAMSQNLCIDEQMVPFKGKSQLRQYIPSKPKK